MQIEERVVNDVTILDLKGKITLGEGDEALKDKINSLIQQKRKRILLNLAEVPYIDSAGLGEVVRTYTTVSRQGGQLKLVHLTKRITDLLIDHQAADGLRDVRLGGRSAQELLVKAPDGTARAVPRRRIPVSSASPVSSPAGTTQCAARRPRICCGHSGLTSGRRTCSSSPA